MSKVKDVKGVRGLVKLAKEIAVTATTGSHDNEFIGRCRIPLKVICYIIKIILNIFVCYRTRNSSLRAFNNIN